ncbi:MAG: hypothetical protein ACRDQ5_03780 [Sciscionella sp.]
MDRDEVDSWTWCPDLITPSKRHLPDTEDGVARELSYIDWRRPTATGVAIIAECRQLADTPREDIGDVPLFEPCAACIAARGDAVIAHRPPALPRLLASRVTSGVPVVSQDSRSACGADLESL